MRCLTLAESLREKGASVQFVCRLHEGHLCELIEERGFKVTRLRAAKTTIRTEAHLAHSAWLGASWQDDAEQTCAGIGAMGIKPDWLIVDHYALDEQWEQSLRPFVDRVFAIDDLADRKHDCDVLLDQNLVENIQARYNKKVSRYCTLLLGPQYALLQRIYADLRDRIPPREGPIKRILIFFGGADERNLTGLALQALINLNRPDIKADVVFRGDSYHADNIRKQAEGRANVHLHSNLPSLASLVAQADLALGASGATSWERLCLGLPTLVVTLAENQKPIAECLHRRKLAHWLGHVDEVSVGQLEQVLAERIEQGIDIVDSLNCRATVDGRGAERVRSVIRIDAMPSLNCRYARLSDESQLLEWAAGPATHRYTCTMHTPSADEYHRQLATKLRDIDNCRIFIAETDDGISVGHVQFDKDGDAWDVDYSVAGGFRGAEFRKKLLAAALLRLRTEEVGLIVLGRSSSNSVRSNRISEGLGSPPKMSGRRLRIAVCSDQKSWLNSSIPELLLRWVADGHEVCWAHNATQLEAGDLCFYLSYGRIVKRNLLVRFTHNLVVHESNLPQGRGWSPVTWQILEGADEIPVTLLEAAADVDSGAIYAREKIRLNGGELIHELRAAQSAATLKLCRDFVENYPQSASKYRLQHGEPSYYPRRLPKDSEIDPRKSINELFNLFRVVDNDRYPAWFERSGELYKLRIEKRKGGRQ